MGLCWSSLAAPSTPHTTGHLSTGSTGTSQATTTTASSSGSSYVSQASHSSLSSGSEVYPSGQILPTPNIRCFSFAELRVATRNFRADMLLGEGGFGKVFKGYLDEKTSVRSGVGTVVAVKKLNPESWQGFEEWQSEVNFLGRLSHPNLVKLLGYCWENQELLLVYEFMQKGSLENHLFGKGSTAQPLPWDIRLKIATAAARGLAFLHTSERQVIYRDFKASNILLDGSYTAKISDFGLAKFGPTASQSHVTTRVIGTHGYAAPEYVATGHLYVKSDVYGFGVVLIELLTGLRALDTSRPSEQQNLVTWVRPLLSERRKVISIVDPRLESKFSSKAAFQIAQLALKCIESRPNDRPSMKEVLESLEALERVESSKVKRLKTGTRSAHSSPKRNGQQLLDPRTPLHRSQNSTRSPLHLSQNGNHSPALHPRQSNMQVSKHSHGVR